MRKLKVIALLAAMTMLAAACSKSDTNSNAGGNTNRPANANANRPATSTGNTNTSSDAGSAFKAATFTPKGGNLYVIQDAGLQFEVPAGWTQVNEGGRLTIHPPDGSVSIIFMVVEMENLQQVTQALGAGLETAMDNVQAKGEPDQDTHNGMTIVSQEGTGIAGGTPIEWNAAIIMAPIKPVVALVTVEPGKVEAHSDALDKFFKSVRPVPTAGQ